MGFSVKGRRGDVMLVSLHAPAVQIFERLCRKLKASNFVLILVWVREN